MADSVSYMVQIGREIDLDQLSSKVELCKPKKGAKICGKYKGFHITVFKDGEIWIEITSEGEQSRQLMDVADFLQGSLKEQGIDVDLTNLLLNAKTMQGSVPPSMITHSVPDNFRPQLKCKAHINLFRLIIHWLMSNELGDRWKEKMKNFGKYIGALAYSSMADSIKDEAGAINALKLFMKNSGIGILNQISPKHGELRLMLDESLTSSGMSNLGRRLCYMESGIIEGFFSKFYNSKVICEEEKCWSLGNDHCEFSIVGEE